MLTKLEKLARIQNYGTRYEVIAEHADGRKMLVGYTIRVSKCGMLSAIQRMGKQIVALCEITDADEMTYSKFGKTKWHQQFQLSNGWRFRFSSRTQRQAIIEGEYDFVGELVKL